MGLTILAAIARSRGQHGHAEALLAESNEVCETEHVAWPTALNSSLQGEIATDLGELDRGEMPGRQGIQLAWVIGERLLRRCPRGPGANAGSSWGSRGGARLYGAVEAVLDATGANLPMTAIPVSGLPLGSPRGARRSAVCGRAGRGSRPFTFRSCWPSARRGRRFGRQRASAPSALRHPSASRHGAGSAADRSRTHQP